MSVAQLVPETWELTGDDARADREVVVGGVVKADRAGQFIDAGPAYVQGRRDGAFMEPSRRNRWQPVANGTPPKTAQTGRRCVT